MTLPDTSLLEILEDCYSSGLAPVGSKRTRYYAEIDERDEGLLAACRTLAEHGHLIRLSDQTFVLSVKGKRAVFERILA